MKRSMHNVVKVIGCLWCVTSLYAVEVIEILNYPLLRGNVSPANAATYTINRSGVYKLTCAQSASGMPVISITANNVTLDLGDSTLTGGTNGIEISGNNVTVKNGLITGASQSGVLVTGDGCCIETCDLVSCATGITLQGSHESVVQDCHVRSATQAGVSLVQSFTNSILGCTVQGVESANNVYGFIAADGGNNVFDRCSVSDVRTTVTTSALVDVPGWTNGESGGFVFKGLEQGSQVLNCSGSAITGLDGYKNQSYGIGCLSGATLTGADALLSVTKVLDAGGPIHSVAWMVSDDRSYIAVGREDSRLILYQFDEETEGLSYVAESSYPESSVFSVAWLMSGEKRYLASGGSTNLGANEVSIVSFDASTSSLVSVTHSSYAEGSVWSVAWLVSGDKKYLASGGSGSNTVSIYEFDEASSSLLSVTHSSYAGSVESVAWLVSGDKKYLATGGYNTKKVSILEFEEGTSSLLSVTQSEYPNSSIYSASWLVINDRKYLATGGDNVDDFIEVSILEFDDLTSNLLSVTQNSEVAGDFIDSVAWLIAGDKKYLAAGCGGVNKVAVFEFDFSTQSLLSVTQNQSLSGDVYSVAWLESGNKKYLAAGEYTPSEVAIFEFDGFSQQQPSNCILSNNSIKDVHTTQGNLNVVGGTPVGTGLTITTTNQYVAKNTAYDCDSAFYGVPAQYITSQANDRGAYNIDTASTTPDQVEAITPSVVSTATLNYISQNFSEIDAALDRFGCTEVPVTAPGTLSSAGSYCLADTINGTLSIAGADITLCMNACTINGGILSISGDRVTVSDGTVRGNAAASGVVVTGDSCYLKDVRSIANRTGFEVNGAANTVLDNCYAINCTREGFLLDAASRSYVSDCQVTSLVGTGTIAGFKTMNGTSNKITGCSVNGVETTNGDAYGLWGVGEHKSLILDNTVNQVSAAVGQAYGITVENPLWLNSSPTSDQTFSQPINRLYSISWLRVRPGLSYLAASGSSNLLIFKFENNSFDLCYAQDFPGTTDSEAQWLRHDGVNYLAVCWSTSDDAAELQVYVFDEVAKTLSPLPDTAYIYDQALYPISIAWLDKGRDGVFLGLAGIYLTSGNNVRILSFDGVSLNYIAGATVPLSNLYGFAWASTSTQLLCSVTAPTGDLCRENALSIYEFVGAGNLSLKSTFSIGNTSFTSGAGSSSWVEYEGHFYIAFGLYRNTEPQVRVLEYNPATSDLTQLVAYQVNASSTYVYVLDWLVTGTNLYLAFGTNNATKELLITRFDPVAKTLEDVWVPQFSDVILAQSVGWLTGDIGKVYLGVGFNATVTEPRTVSVFGFDLVGSMTGAVLQNTISNVAGKGMYVNDLSDGLLSNRVYASSMPYYPNYPNQFDPSNEIVQ